MNDGGWWSWASVCKQSEAAVAAAVAAASAYTNPEIAEAAAEAAREAAADKAALEGLEEHDFCSQLGFDQQKLHFRYSCLKAGSCTGDENQPCAEGAMGVFCSSVCTPKHWCCRYAI